MRRVTGPTDRVVVVGAGLGGLACAIRLAATGRAVTVLERDPAPGGRVGRFSQDGYTFDTGPTVLTLPSLLEETFQAVGERLSDWLDLVRLDPAYRAHFPDGSTLDARSGTAATAEEIARVCGPREADGFLRFVDYARHLYDLQWDAFIDRNFDSMGDLVGPALWRLLRAGGFGGMARRIDSFFADSRTRRLFSFQAMYAGMAPHRARALYTVISYLDTVCGVFYPRGGLHEIPQAMAAVAVKHGVDLRYDAEVVDIVVSSRRARTVRTAAGERFDADVVVINPDTALAHRRLLRRPLRRRLRYSPSCMLIHVGATGGNPAAAHHNIHFGQAWRSMFTDVIDRGRLMSDPSLLVCNPSVTDPTLAPGGGSSYYVLAPVPNLSAPIDWAATGPRYADELLARLDRLGYTNVTEAAVRKVVTPADWERMGLPMGTPFTLAHTMTQTGPMRPGNLAPGLENVVFVGAGTQPGVGVPMVLVSAGLAAERVAGAAAGR